MKPWFGPKRFGWGVGVRRWQGVAVFVGYALAGGAVRAASPDSTTWWIGEGALTILLVAIIAATWDRAPKSR
jgi:hypothetical protein